MKQTAVEWYHEEMESIEYRFRSREITFEKWRFLTKDAFEKAKEMEINQHTETWDVAHQAGRFEGKGIAEKDWQTFETHWEETFKSE